VIFTVNVTNVDVGNDTFNNNTINVSSGRLGVTVADGSWEIGSGGVLNLNDVGIDPTIVAGSELRVGNNGIINVFGAEANINTPIVVEEGGLIEIEDTNGFLDINAQLTLAGGEINRVVGAGNTLLNFASLLVTGDSSVTLSRFDWDSGPTTVESSGSLDINVTSIEASGAEVYDGTLTINGGTVTVDNFPNRWINDGRINLNNGGVLQGVRLSMGDDLETLNADLVVGGTGISRIIAPLTFFSDADVQINSGATLRTSLVTFESVQGANNAEFTGDGRWLLMGANTVNENTTINMVGGSVDLDNSSIFTMTANDTALDANLTINVATMLSYGAIQSFGGPATFSELDIADTATLTVNLDNPKDEWTVTNVGIVNYNGNFSVNTFLAGSDLNMNGTLNVTGDGRVAARLDIGGTINITGNGADEGLRLNGGTLANPNRLVGGTINGNAQGPLKADTSRALHGFGTINAEVWAFERPRRLH